MDYESAGRELLISFGYGNVQRKTSLRFRLSLWHYTTTSGLKGILEKERLWATDTRFLNDTGRVNMDWKFSLKSAGEQDLTSRKPETQRLLLV